MQGDLFAEDAGRPHRAPREGHSEAPPSPRRHAAPGAPSDHESGRPEQVARLRTLGRPVLHDWPDLEALGLTGEHEQALIGILDDPAFSWDDAEGPEFYTRIHGWRALAQMRSGAAIEALLRVLAESDDVDWASEELPWVFKRIGAKAVPGLIRFVRDRGQGPFARATAGASLARIAADDDRVKEDAIRSLTAVLEEATAEEPILNALLIGNLLDLRAVEAAPVIERTFASGFVDRWVNGDWEDVQIELGLKSSRDTPRGISGFRALLSRVALSDDAMNEARPETDGDSQTPSSKKKTKKSRKRMQKESRRRNRKRR